jgi:hypothetical protein
MTVAATRTLGISPGLKQLNIKHLDAAAKVLGYLTRPQTKANFHSQNPTLLLGQYEQPITEFTQELGTEHIPSARPENELNSFARSFRSSVLGFLAGASRIRDGVEQLDQIVSQKDFTYLPDLVGQFNDQEVPEYRTSNWECDNEFGAAMETLPKHILVRLGWHLQDQVCGSPVKNDPGLIFGANESHTSEECLALATIKRVKIDPQWMMNTLDSSRLRIVGLGMTNRTAVNVLGMANTYNLHFDGLGNARPGYFPESEFVPLRDIVLQNGRYVLRSTRWSPERADFKWSYAPNELKYVVATSAAEPIILSA